MRSTRLSHAPTGFEVCNFKLEFDSRVASYDCQTDRTEYQYAQIAQTRETRSKPRSRLALDERHQQTQTIWTLSLRLPLFLFQLPDVSPDPPANYQNADDADDEVKAMKQSLERFVFVPLFAEFLAHISQT